MKVDEIIIYIVYYHEILLTFVQFHKKVADFHDFWFNSLKDQNIFNKFG